MSSASTQNLQLRFTQAHRHTNSQASMLRSTASSNLGVPALHRTNSQSSFVRHFSDELISAFQMDSKTEELSRLELNLWDKKHRLSLQRREVEELERRIAEAEQKLRDKAMANGTMVGDSVGGAS
ncbi:hypothetical protein NEOLI_001622 [Neolecta irregularis DAH-3]|uniref:Uncharacterized protein n=1 Tax=Neolecta irregularis (strain DAH-3) TaxID=1198029 RepID=A0A1U7LSJ1_NEOID|nr:hypothetical protein NEOLI_001622 [Neolecta irregularis DAH-3]|eukprot:OLL25640.1 hypothetical protein NEOLI_001622 [Neolecta irregularis DAH-3]